MFSFFAGFMIAQVVSISIVVFCLKKVLDSNLIDLALRQLEFQRREAEAPKVSRVAVLSHKPLRSKVQERIKSIVSKRFGPGVELSWAIDRKLMGGIIIRVDKDEIEFSLRERLRQAIEQRGA